MSVKTKSVKADDLSELLGEPEMMAAAPVLVIPSIWDQYGHVRTDMSGEAATIEALPDSMRAILFATLADCRAAEECEAKVATLRREVLLAMHAENVANAANDKNNPPLTQGEILAAVLHANNPDVVPKPKGRRPVNPRPLAELKAASAALSAVRDDLQHSQADLRVKSKLKADAIGRWVACLPTITPESVTRAYLARDGAERLGLANGTIVPPVVAPVKTWPLEDALNARGALKSKRQYRGALGTTKPTLTARAPR